MKTTKTNHASHPVEAHAGIDADFDAGFTVNITKRIRETMRFPFGSEGQTIGQTIDNMLDFHARDMSDGPMMLESIEDITVSLTDAAWYTYRAAARRADAERSQRPYEATDYAR